MSNAMGTPARKMLGRIGAGALRGGLDQLVRRNLRGVWVRGNLPMGPAVWASNHHSWWDFFVGAAALRTEARTDVDVVMQADNIGSRSLFHTVGVIGTDEIRLALDSLRQGRVVIIFPEGELRAAGELGTTKRGAQWLSRTSATPLQLVATRVVLRAQQAPEAFIDITEWNPEGAPSCEDAHRAHLQQLDQDLLGTGPTVVPAGFRNVIVGVRNWDERFQTLRPPPT